MMRELSMPSIDSYFDSPAAVLEPMVRASTYGGFDSLTQRLIEIKDWLAEDLTLLEADLQSRPGDCDDLADRAAAHLLRQPGKRIRPLCVVLAARVGGGLMTPVIRDLAVACELVHAATLLHDDVLDQGTERRGAEASRIVYGNSASILGGDYLLIEALRRVRRTGDDQALKTLMDVIDLMIRAEAIQLDRRGRFDSDRDTYMQIIYGKTASIFEWGLRSGAVASGMSVDAAAALGRIGRYIGLSFQVVDDILDLAGDPDVTGKDGLSDIKEGKVTWPLILASEMDESLGDELQRIAVQPDLLTSDYAAQLRGRLRDTGCLEHTRERAQEFATLAEDELRGLPEGQGCEALSTVIQSVVNRGM